MKSTLFSIFFVILSCQLLAQSVSDCHKEGGAFISEIYNEGKADYIELTVYGSTANPTAPVNLEGWILDDNNTSKKDIGNQTGHIRLGSCFAAVNPGTIILIYTPTHYDPLKANPANDGFRDYEIQTSWKCLVPYLACPNKIGKNTGYDCEPTILAPTTSWNMKELIPLYNNADVLQLRNKEGELEHAIYWTADYDEKDNPKAVSVLEQITKLSTQYFTVNKWSIHFTADKDWLNTANFEVSGNSTLGTQNNTAHGNLIAKCKNGTFSTALKATVDVKKQPTSRDNDGEIAINVISEFSGTISIFSKDFYQKRKFHKGINKFGQLSKGDYSIIIQDAEDCSVLLEINLDSKSTPICPTSCETIGIGKDDYCKYEWNVHTDITDVNLPKQTLCPSKTTTYVIKVIDNEGDQKEIPFTIEVKEAKINPSPVLKLAGEEKEIEVYGSLPKWSTGETQNKIKIRDFGAYKVEVTDDDTDCRINGSIEVLDACKPKDIKRYFTENNFLYNPDVDIIDIPSLINNTGKDRSIICNIENKAKDILRIKGIAFDLTSFLLERCQDASNCVENIFITDNESLCKGTTLVDIEARFKASNKSYWLHLYSSAAEDIVFFKYSYKSLQNDCKGYLFHLDELDYEPDEEINTADDCILGSENSEKAAALVLYDPSNKFEPLFDSDVRYGLIEDSFKTSPNSSVANLQKYTWAEYKKDYYNCNYGKMKGNMAEAYFVYAAFFDADNPQSVPSNTLKICLGTAWKQILSDSYKKCITKSGRKSIAELSTCVMKEIYDEHDDCKDLAEDSPYYFDIKIHPDKLVDVKFTYSKDNPKDQFDIFFTDNGQPRKESFVKDRLFLCEIKANKADSQLYYEEAIEKAWAQATRNLKLAKYANIDPLPVPVVILDKNVYTAALGKENIKKKILKMEQDLKKYQGGIYILDNLSNGSNGWLWDIKTKIQKGTDEPPKGYFKY